jgi:hypothetical protein
MNLRTLSTPYLRDQARWLVEEIAATCSPDEKRDRRAELADIRAELRRRVIEGTQDSVRE